MLFSSVSFIFLFLPLVVMLYYLFLIKGRKASNYLLCIASLFFYAWGEPKYVIVLLVSITINWWVGLSIARYQVWKKQLLVFATIVNIGIIFVFKYLMFTLTSINRVFNASIVVPSIALPIGISFFTFQALSYVMDVYRGKAEAQKNLMNVALYISFFPQLIAGPIVRYETIAHAINNRKESIEDISDGVFRFIMGLGKKVILANNMAIIVDHAYKLLSTHVWLGAEKNLSAGFAWLGAIAYTFQIYFDFSGYSDMAVGLGKVFGFHFLENFNYPYISRTITEFWRRWHISLSFWFRDYVYIPLGGNRGTSTRTVVNLFIVWLLTGIWHGANWTFIAWGILYLIVLLFEKFTGLQKKEISGVGRVLSHVYTLLVVILAWVVFRSNSLSEARNYISIMFSGFDWHSEDISLFYLREYWVYFVLCSVLSTPIVANLKERMKRHVEMENIVYPVFAVIVFVVSISFIVKGSYNPFIYFNF